MRHLEAAAFSEAMRAVKPDQQRPDLLVTSVSSPILDSSRLFDVYYVCGGRNQIGCDPEFDRRYTEAKVLTGDARDKAFQGLWEYAYDKYWYVPLFGLNWAHGASARLQWTPRVDGTGAVHRDEPEPLSPTAGLRSPGPTHELQSAVAEIPGLPLAGGTQAHFPRAPHTTTRQGEMGRCRSGAARDERGVKQW